MRRRAGAVVLDESGEKVLLVTSSNPAWKDRWILPAGGIEDNEDALTAARREVEEEAGVQTISLKELFCYEDSLRSTSTTWFLFRHCYTFPQKQWKESNMRLRKWFSWEEAKHLLTWRRDSWEAIQRAEMTSLDWKLIPIYTLLYAAYRKRKDISSALRHCYHTFQQVLNVIDSGSNCFLKASNDLKDYFNGMGDDDVPISFVRLLRLFSSPEFLLIFRNISAGASQGICREFVARPQENKSKRRKSQQSEASNDRVAVLSKLLEAFVTPSGEHVASLIVSTAVREGLSTVFERYDRETAYASKKRKNGFAKSIHEDNQQKKETVEDFPPIVKALLDTALSDEGRKFMIDLSVAVTATAIPLVIRNVCKNQTNNLTPKLEPNIESYSTVGSNSKISKEELNKVSVSLHQRSTSSMLPFFRRQPNEMIDETSKEQSTPNNHWRGTSASSFFQKAAKLLGKEKKITEISDEKNHFQNVAEAPSASKESTKLKDETFIEKLFFTVFNDRQLLTDLAKTASYEAVRSYLLTQHELNSRNTTIKTTKRWTAPMTSKGVLCRKLCGDLFYQWLYHEGREPQWFFI